MKFEPKPRSNPSAGTYLDSIAFDSIAFEPTTMAYLRIHGATQLRILTSNPSSDQFEPIKFEPIGIPWFESVTFEARNAPYFESPESIGLDDVFAIVHGVEAVHSEIS